MRFFISALLVIFLDEGSRGVFSQDSSNEQVQDEKTVGKQSVEKKSAPETKLVAAATRKINRLFAKELAQRDPVILKAAIETLIETGLEENDEVKQFALFQLAHKEAVDICEPGLAQKSLEELQKQFEIDIWNMQLDSLRKLSRNARTADQLKSVLQNYESIVQQAVESEEFAAAISLTDGMNSAARKLRVSEVSDKIKRTKEYLLFSKRIHDRWQQSVDEKADEAIVQFNRGLFLFFVKNNADGLALIAKKNDTTIGKLASDELSKPDDKKRIEIAKGWLKWADALSAKARFEEGVAKSHAARILKDVIPRLKGIEKKELENLVAKLGDVGNTTPGSSIIDSKIKNGRWAMDWESQQDWELFVISPYKIEVTVKGKVESCDYKVEGGVISFQMAHPHRVYYIEMENGAVIGRLVDRRDGRLINKGKGVPLK